MKTNVLTYLVAGFFSFSSLNGIAQHATPKAPAYPAAFTISTAEFDNLFLHRINEPLAVKTNKYLDKAVLLINTKNGDMQLLKLKLDYFKHAFLYVQINGSASTQVFILSDNKSVFYKGSFEKNGLLMSKCREDDIVSE